MSLRVGGVPGGLAPAVYHSSTLSRRGLVTKQNSYYPPPGPLVRGLTLLDCNHQPYTTKHNLSRSPITSPQGADRIRKPPSRKGAELQPLTGIEDGTLTELYHQPEA